MTSEQDNLRAAQVTFEAWIRGTAELPEGQEEEALDLCEKLQFCEDPMPPELCAELGLPDGTPYRRGVGHLLKTSLAGRDLVRRPRGEG